jgi:maltooligosyltrehalose trehalohydrolase
VDGAVLAERAFVVRFFGSGANDDRLLIVSYGTAVRLVPAPEPLLAPPPGMRWETAWSSEDPAYGGGGTPELERENGWYLPGACAAVMRPAARAEPKQARRA